MNQKIALINCPMWDVEFTPYNIALLCAVLKQNNFDADCFDFNLEWHNLDKDLWNLPDIYSFWQSKEKIQGLFHNRKALLNNFIDRLKPYKILGFTVQSLNFTFTLELAGVIKNAFPEKFIILGGPECFRNFNPEYLIGHDCIDAVCCGEGEMSFPEIAAKFNNGQELYTPGFFIKKNNGYIDCGEREFSLNLNDLPFADYDFLKKDTTKISISTSRGCICQCAFCPEKSHWQKYCYRSGDSVFQEIEGLRKRFASLDFVYLNDSLINGNMEELNKFCDLMIHWDSHIQWGGHALIRKEMTKDFLLKMKQAGAQRLNYGIESGSDRILKLMRKNFNKQLALRVLEETKKAGISFSVNLIVGFPGETESDFQETKRLFLSIKRLTGCIHINPCYVLKGTQLYNDYVNWKILLPDNFVTDWSSVDCLNNQQVRMNRVRALEEMKG